MDTTVVVAAFGLASAVIVAALAVFGKRVDAGGPAFDNLQEDYQRIKGERDADRVEKAAEKARADAAETALAKVLTYQGIIQAYGRAMAGRTGEDWNPPPQEGDGLL